MQALIRRFTIAAAAAFALTTAAPAQLWTPANNPMANTRYDGESTLLPDGRVLVSGHPSVPFEMYTPATNNFTPFSMEPPDRGEAGTATLLLDGRVLLVGGIRISHFVLQSQSRTDILDVNSGVVTNVANAPNAHSDHTATRLSDGRVVVIGGGDRAECNCEQMIDIFNPATNLWSPGGTLQVPRVDHTATLLPNGKILVVGGAQTTSVELYDPATQTSSIVTNLSVVRWKATATLLADGRVVIAGGHPTARFLFDAGGGSQPHASVDIFNPATNAFTPGPTMLQGRAEHVAALLNDGRILFASGWAYPAESNSAELYDVTTGSVVTASTFYGHASAEAVRLLDGRVFVAGGIQVKNRGEVYTPPAGPVVPRRGDFEADGRSDVLWWNSVNHNLIVWSMNGTTANGYEPPTWPETSWNFMNLGDFDGSGTTDLIFRNPAASGESEIFFTKPGGGLLKTLVIQGAPLDWSVVATADFDGNGTDDLFWRRPSTGQTAVWLMSVNGPVDGSELPKIVEPGWIPAAVDDFDGDGMADILWRHTGRGENYIWFMDRFTPERAGHIVPVGDQNFQVAATGDFNGDGKADLIWRNNITGETVLWHLDGTAANGSHLPAMPSTAWRFASVGDYNGDGKSDIFWRNLSNGETAVWLIDGFSVIGAGSLASVNEPNWINGIP